LSLGPVFKITSQYCAIFSFSGFCENPESDAANRKAIKISGFSILFWVY
jgi:hypothetical protein